MARLVPLPAEDTLAHLEILVRKHGCNIKYGSMTGCGCCMGFEIKSTNPNRSEIRGYGSLPDAVDAAFAAHERWEKKYKEANQ